MSSCQDALYPEKRKPQDLSIQEKCKRFNSLRKIITDKERWMFKCLALSPMSDSERERMVAQKEILDELKEIIYHEN